MPWDSVWTSLLTHHSYFSLLSCLLHPAERSHWRLFAKSPLWLTFLCSPSQDLKTIFLLNPKSVMSSLRSAWHLVLISKLSWRQAPRASFIYAYATSAHCLSLLCSNHQLRVLSPRLPVLTASSTTICLGTDPGSLLWSLQILLLLRLPWWLSKVPSRTGW